MKYFKKEEFSCPHCGENEIDETFLQLLDKARELAGVPFVINSGYRCQEHNEDVGGLPNSSHLFGVAADIKCVNSADRFTIVDALIRAGFVRIGVADSFIHVDLDYVKPQCVMWVY